MKAPTVGWGTARTIGDLAAALALLVAFDRNPLGPLSIFKINGLAYADVTQLIAFAGFLAMFFFLSLSTESSTAAVVSRTSHRNPPSFRPMSL
ncbi:MAG: hypothetical protein WBP81_33725 [Solirubrobacteraceae bacterium]